jgi:hypothetical protein
MVVAVVVAAVAASAGLWIEPCYRSLGEGIVAQSA